MIGESDVGWLARFKDARRRSVQFMLREKLYFFGAAARSRLRRTTAVHTDHPRDQRLAVEAGCQLRQEIFAHAKYLALESCQVRKGMANVSAELAC